VSRIRSIALAGTAYFGIVFTCAFAVGTVRVLIVAPRIGEVAAVLLEAPIIIALSWFVCGWSVPRFAVPAGPAARVGMGVVAFALLMAAEAGLAVLVFGQSLAAHFAAYTRLAAAPGLWAQLVLPPCPRSMRPRPPASAQALDGFDLRHDLIGVGAADDFDNCAGMARR
jgi:hypothetical protein